MKVLGAYQDGQVFDAAVLDIDDSVLITKFLNGVSHVAAFGREVGIPTEAGLPHMFTKAFKNCVAAVVEVDFNAGEKVQEIKDILSDPEKLAAMKAAAAAGPAAGGGAAAGGAAEAKKEEVVEEEEEEMDFDLFG
jgi:large subunit ribosomal protein LP0